MSWSTLAEGGANPIVISESGGGRERDGNIGIWIILLFIFIIAVVAIPLMSRREPVANSNSSLAEILPAMMIAQSTSQRQTVDVNSHNTGGGCGAGPSNFQLYQQGVATNDNVFVQSCQTRELIREDGQTTRDLINEQYVHSLELQIADKNAQLIAKDNQLVSERQFGALTAQNTANYNSLQQQIYSLSGQIQKEPIPAYCVSPYAGYRPGFVFSEPAGERGGCHRDC